jgi:cysteine-rich repeat protein
MCTGAAEEGCPCAEEGVTVSCGADLGVCVTGLRKCLGAEWGPCAGGVAPAEETCDELDNDCDGAVDESCTCSEGTTLPCGTDEGSCVRGMQTCRGGELGPCEGMVPPRPEECNELDDDCNGVVDEGCPGVAACGDGAVEGAENCDDGNPNDGDGCSAACQREGCAAGDRVGLRDTVTYPDVAICGAAIGTYSDAVATAATVCQAGWHMCPAYAGNQLNAYLADKPTPAGEGWIGWLEASDLVCTQQTFHPANDCSGNVDGAIFFVGGGGCENGTCGEGYRPALTTWYWGYGMRNGVGGACTAHASYACAFPGGSRPQDLAFTTCCR